MNLEDMIDDATGSNRMSMKRDRPYDGQPHTSTGIRGATEIKDITFRDLRDCFIRAMIRASAHIEGSEYDEACKGENARLCGNDLYGWDLNKLDPVAICQNLCVEVEKIMGIYPNIGG